MTVMDVYYIQEGITPQTGVVIYRNYNGDRRIIADSNFKEVLNEPYFLFMNVIFYKYNTLIDYVFIFVF